MNTGNRAAAFVRVHIDAGASISMPACVGDDPIPRCHIGKIVEAGNRLVSHGRQRPTPILVVEPPVGGRRIVQPTTTIFPRLRKRMTIEQGNR